jgi:hypothetical protein
MFAHPSEQDWADLFDRHQIAWQYEPFLFPLKWSTKGKIIKAFKPDFYLPDRSLFVEVTVMRQDLTTKKRNKVKTAMQVYTSMRIKLFTYRDYVRCVVEDQFDPAKDLTV